jgi:uncharacterized protein
MSYKSHTSHTSHTTRALRRPATRVLAGAAALAAAVVAVPGAAQAHVTVQPGTVEGGSFSVVALRVPNERDDASTTRLQVLLPKDQPIGSVQTTPVPGWTVKTATRHLAEPIDFFGQQLDTVVSRVTWTATGDGIEPGQFQDFELSLGMLPDSGTMAFNAFQTYSSGERVSWNEVSTDPSAEPEHPAPTLTLTAAAPEQGTATGQGADEQADDASPVTAPAAETGSDSSLPLLLSGAALLVSLVAAAAALRRRPRAVAVPTPSPLGSDSTREDARV